ncbi:hypothetical protein Q5O_20500 [Pseudomonas putida JB]|uniref:hypothetical protein n=1 Tax=Pseudomonas putida TaxID=303 RepID=UPI00087852BE|nr:hypothetical protein [Pseudomonas putida]AOX10665.1 hypothetical protein Q5O_20500 [Pseudomonas putida JB]
MIITKVIGDCPKCNKPHCFGNVSVFEDHLLRGCSECSYSIHLPLPQIQKKVLYLDQFFFSGAFRGNDPRFVDAAHRVKKIAQLQLLVAPHSSIHEDETFQWRGHKEFTSTKLLDFIKESSRGLEFHPDYEVEATQVTKAWKLFLDGAPSTYAIDRREAISGALNEWESYYRINVPGYYKNAELCRALKEEAVDTLIKVFDEWQKSANTFKEDVDIETNATAELYLNSYITMINRIIDGDASATLDSPIVSQVVEQMIDWLPKEQPLLDKIKTCIEFFKSEHFKQTPSIYISTRIYATLKSMVKLGAYANRTNARKKLNGVFGDIKHISLYAPYCDAFFMDQPMADLVRQPSVSLEKRYGVRVFSLNNLPQFYEWLDQLESEMTSEHRAAVDSAYPR